MTLLQFKLEEDTCGFPTAKFQQDGFTVLLVSEPDLDPDLSYLAKWVNGEVVATTTAKEHKEGLIHVGYSEEEADRLSQEYVESDCDRFRRHGVDWCAIGLIVKVYKCGVELGSASLWGFDSDSGEEEIRLTVLELTDDAIDQAKSKLQELKES